LTLLQGRRAMLNTKVSTTKYNNNGQDVATTTKGPKSTNYASLFKNEAFLLNYDSNTGISLEFFAFNK
jgi:hypothetical protein